MEKAFGLEIPESLEDACELNRTALVVYDMQVGIFSQLSNADPIKNKVVQILQVARETGLRIFFMRHMSLPKELSGVFQLKTAKAWQRVTSTDDVNPWFLRDAPGFHLIPEVAPLPSEAIFDKITMSAFESTPLDIALRDCGIQSVIIVGVATEIGIEPTIRHAADLGYIPIMVTDACGAGDEAAGQRAVASLRFMGDAFFTQVDELSSILRKKAGI
ncbi:isochorismatase family protein [Synechococcus sp. PCC 7335]|uniref:cysteine hydrolase family protein n=1 Tax=Synechococcus sp. (strain ATCC 29403 / PCC 7335) TaxID=91464 RepID=UPI00017EB10A|nr:cysteine hydrolase [Synechococcus sp. PCC 7335]EDX84661.1 isochorismatase family protein [Synechococcus sp. PCC 7335]